MDKTPQERLDQLRRTFPDRTSPQDQQILQDLATDYRPDAGWNSEQSSVSIAPSRGRSKDSSTVAVDNPISDNNTYDSEEDSRSPHSRTLIEATSHIRAGLQPDGTPQGHQDDSERWGWEWQRLEEFLQKEAVVLPAGFPNPQRVGGHEHDVRYDPDTGRWWKYTKPNSSGKTVEWDGMGTPAMFNAYVSDYLDRLHLQNQVFKDDIHIEGIQRISPHDKRIVTSQPDVVGEPVDEQEIVRLMKDMGFDLLPWRGIGREDALAFSNGEFAVWDVHGENVVKVGRVLVPIDVIVTRVPKRVPKDHH